MGGCLCACVCVCVCVGGGLGITLFVYLFAKWRVLQGIHHVRCSMVGKLSLFILLLSFPPHSQSRYLGGHKTQ